MTKAQKACFGVLESVFPLGDEGIREVRAECFDCPLKKECLQTALKTREGLNFRAELIARAPVRGIADRIRRWSEMKDISMQIGKKEKTDDRD